MRSEIELARTYKDRALTEWLDRFGADPERAATAHAMRTVLAERQRAYKAPKGSK